MNYIQELYFLDDSLNRYEARLQKMEENTKSGKMTYRQIDWDTTINKIDKMQRLYPKLVEKALLQMRIREFTINKGLTERLVESGNIETTIPFKHMVDNEELPIIIA